MNYLLDVDVTKMSKKEIQDYISDLEQVASLSNPKTMPIEVPIKHYFSKDVYAREMSVPKGAIIIGKIHKYQNMNFLLKGEVSIISIDGLMRVKAPFSFVASPGAKRVFYAHEDSVWTVVHGTDEKDVDKIEEKFIAKTYDEVPQIAEKEIKCLG